MKLWMIVGMGLLPAVASMEQKQNLVSQRAAFDLNCGESIQITKLGNRVYGATGCGKRAAYILECRDTNIESCTAIPNSDSKPESK